MVIDDKNTVVIAEVELREEAMMKGMRQRIVSEKNNLMSQTSADNRSDIALREYFSDRAAVQATLLRTEEIIDDLESKLRQLCPQVSHVTIEVQGITADYELPNQLDKVPG
jgi:zinc transporter 9